MLMATRNPGRTHQLRLVVYPIIYRVFYIQTVVGLGNSLIQGDVGAKSHDDDTGRAVRLSDVSLPYFLQAAVRVNQRLFHPFIWGNGWVTRWTYPVDMCKILFFWSKMCCFSFFFDVHVPSFWRVWTNLKHHLQGLNMMGFIYLSFEMFRGDSHRKAHVVTAQSCFCFLFFWRVLLLLKGKHEHDEIGTT